MALKLWKPETYSNFIERWSDSIWELKRIHREEGGIRLAKITSKINNKAIPCLAIFDIFSLIHHNIKIAWVKPSMFKNNIFGYTWNFLISFFYRFNRCLKPFAVYRQCHLKMSINIHQFEYKDGYREISRIFLIWRYNWNFPISLLLMKATQNESDCLITSWKREWWSSLKILLKFSVIGKGKYEYPRLFGLCKCRKRCRN